MKVLRLIDRHRNIRSILRTLEGLTGSGGSDGRVRGECSLPRAVTGRLLFHNPNLQGVEKGDVDGVKVRKFFRTKSVKTSPVRCDFQQYELTLLSQTAGCQKLIEYLRDGGDFYLKIARDMF